MAQEDKGLVMRGLLLLAAIGVLVASVLAIVFWRPQTSPPTAEAPPEHLVATVVMPPIGDFPCAISWGAIFQLGQTMPSAPGFDIRYNAATTLARRGSDQAPWQLIREMLDEQQQMRNNRVRLQDGRHVYDEASARTTMVSAMKAITAWHEKRKDDPKREFPMELREIYTMVDKIADSEFVELKLQAEKTRGGFFR